MAVSPRIKKIKPADMPLEQLYAQEKFTPSVKKAILLAEDFSNIRFDYCEKVCTMPACMKDPDRAAIKTFDGPVDILVIQEQVPMDEKWKTGHQVNRIHRKLMGYMMSQVNQSQLVVDYVDLVKCANKYNPVKGKHKAATATQMSSCAPYLYDQIRKANPKVIISTSSTATKVLGLKKSNYNNRGEFHLAMIPGMENPIPVVLTLHASVLVMIRQNASGKMYGPDFFSVIRRDFQKACELAGQKYAAGDVRVAINDLKKRGAITYCKDMDDVIKYYNEIMALPESAVFSWDTETTSLDPWSDDARLLCSQFGWRRADGTLIGVSFPLWHKDNPMDPEVIWGYVVQILLRPNPKVGHNVKFDIVFTQVTTGIRPVNIAFDTLLCAHSLNSGIQGNYSLKTVIWDWIPETSLGGYEDLLDESLTPEQIEIIKAELKKEREAKKALGITDSDDEEEDEE